MRSKVQALTALLLVALVSGCAPKSPEQPEPAKQVSEAANPAATWPWPDAIKTSLRKGVEHWFVRTTSDGCTLDLFRFDFVSNPRLEFRLDDQDEDDTVPFDNWADYYPHGVGDVTRRLNGSGKGQVVAAWNGLFFSYDRSKNPPNGLARHIGPVVLAGRPHYNFGAHRWTFGAKIVGGRQVFKAVHTPQYGTLAKEFDYAADGAQCLVSEGKPLCLQPFPKVGDPPLGQPVPSTPEDAGHIPIVDHMRTSRTSMGWSKDSRYLYLLVVNEPDSELGSSLNLKRGGKPDPGWTLADLQRFWMKMKVWGAVNSDGGAVTQFDYLRPDGQYEMLPPRLVAPNKRLSFGPNFEGAPVGGTLMYFYVSES